MFCKSKMKHLIFLKAFAVHGWIGLILIILAWPANWFLAGLRSHLLFFPLWLGYILAVDALVLMRKNTSLLMRSFRDGKGIGKFAGLFIVSAPAWWLFEALNWRVQNWHYLGRDCFTDFQYALFATVSFSTVMPAVFGTAELVGTFSFIRRFKAGPIIYPTRKIIVSFFILGISMLAVLLAWPQYFFPLLWLSVFFIIEPINIILGYPSLTDFTKRGDWRPIISLWLGCLICGFFWEMWNYWSYPKWTYTIPYVDFWHVFEMPLLGYAGYIPFSLELFVLYHLMTGLLRWPDAEVSSGLFS
jgi:hypothetical protein